MNVTLDSHREAAIIGWSCRLPGAGSIPDFWKLLREGRCAVSRVPADRWSLERYGHPRPQERGKSYTWAAGVLDDIWGFDPGPFGITPREAEQMDPQQRLLLELTWEALEDAGLPPSSLAGSETGVFVGASAIDYGDLRLFDPAGGDAYFGTGNALAVIANRISHVFDLRGPSLAIDTACSSSLVALNEALIALRSGRIETAIVGGVNILAAPFNFIVFSQAQMLSPTGLCRAFSAKADGYVRGEGGVVLILRRLTQARAARNPVRSVVVASDVNSDGRTNGIALPSQAAQTALLQRIYGRLELDPDRIAFVEAHGTGTRAGDPIEAGSIGAVLGRKRSRPLPIGSVKTNIGHLEPASGLAGVLKAALALQQGCLPASLHFDEPNPDIRFDELNVTVCGAPIDLPQEALYAGINSFGFGGTNAHVVIGGDGARSLPGPEPRRGELAMYLLTAQTRATLAALAQTHAQAIEGKDQATLAERAAAVVHRRERMPARLAVLADSPSEVVAALRSFAGGRTHPDLVEGEVVREPAPVAFVYSGNGGQFAGMGRAAYRANPIFRAQFDAIDRLFGAVADWSLNEALFANDLSERLGRTSVAQPLIFAIQSAATRALVTLGLQPAAVLGHSVGEIAAAEAAGILDLKDAVRLVHCRSKHQEIARGRGRMAMVVATGDEVRRLMTAIKELEIAAVNGPRAFTLVGPPAAVGELLRFARRERIVCRDLDLDYPFHSGLIASVQAPLTADLAALAPRNGAVPFVSTVVGDVLPGSRLDAYYWWRNVREPVRFADAVASAVGRGIRCFIEIGPRGTLLAQIRESAEDAGVDCIALSALERKPPAGDPFRRTVAQAIVRGAAFDADRLFGGDPGDVRLPSYPWQRQPAKIEPTVEAQASPLQPISHPLCGTKSAADGLEWRNHIDTALYPGLADHRFGDQVILPGSAFVEMVLAAAREWTKSETAWVADLEIAQPLVLSDAATKEVLTRISPNSATIEILSRPRLSAGGWQMHARGKIFGHATPEIASPPRHARGKRTAGAELYRIADRIGLHYGQSFRLAEQTVEIGRRRILVELTAAQARSAYGLDPARLDACFHGLFVLIERLRSDQPSAFVPVRFKAAKLFRRGALPVRALIEVSRADQRGITADFQLFDADGSLVAHLQQARFQAARVKRLPDLHALGLVQRRVPADHCLSGAEFHVSPEQVIAAAERLSLLQQKFASLPEDAALLEGWALAMAAEIARSIAVDSRVDLDAAIAAGQVSPTRRAWLFKLLLGLQAAGLAKCERAAVFTLLPDPDLPTGSAVLRAIAAEFPDRSAELLLAGGLDSAVGAGKEQRSTWSARPELVDGSKSARAAADALARILAELKVPGDDRPALRVLQIGHGPLTSRLASLARAGRVRLTIYEPEQRRYELAHAATEGVGDVALADGKNPLPASAFELAIAAEALHRCRELSFAELRRSLAPGGLLLAIEPSSSLFRDVVFGLQEGDGIDANSPPATTAGWLKEMQDAGFRHAIACDSATAAGPSILLAGTDGPVARSNRCAVAIALVGEGVREPLGARLAELASTPAHDRETATGDQCSPILIHLPRVSPGAASDLQRLRDRCLELKQAAESQNGSRRTIWLTFFGAWRNEEPCPVEAGAWAFSRTLANEYPNLDLRRIDLCDADPTRADAILRAVQSNTDERELCLDRGGLFVLRTEPLPRADALSENPAAEAARLIRGAGGIQGLSWEAATRTPPAPGSVEIAVECIGLNFRDVMWALSLIPDDLLEDGFAGPTLGLECAGRVVAVGDGADGFSVGDRVVAFASSAFASHVTVPAAMVSKVPETMSPEEAATIPVAFLTAYYSLVTLAKLKRGERALIHGAAGGVGMAAIQIAQWRGARIVASAGSPEKRQLLHALGVEHVVDSRSPAFADEVLRLSGGVDVVLNSLAGEAMERSLDCLRPFGRFVELGKRDFALNTHVGLRPFRRNLSYFGVDVDQLIRGKRRQGARIFAAIVRQFEAGTFTPLPYRAFDAEHVVDAFRLLQQSGHVGKVLVRPPSSGIVRRAQHRFQIDPQRTHAVTGAFGGFGIETVRWLVDRGARHLLLIGRNGPSSPEACALLSELAARGVQVLVERCDVGDSRSLALVLQRARASSLPIGGVIHAAMVLEDSLAANLNADQLERVLRPKVQGAENLDRLTRGDLLDYFVLFSSITTLLGNPGQASYVAANGYLEGLARRRRAAGLPALAVAFGAIGDAGVVARNANLAQRLEGRAGVRPLPARDALDLMAAALDRPGEIVDEAVIALGSINWSAAGRLPSLGSPTFRALTGDVAAIAVQAGSGDVRELLATAGEDAAVSFVRELIASEVGKVVRLPAAEISHSRPLAEIGLDSLMGIELAMQLQERLGGDIQISANAGALTIRELADEIIRAVGSEQPLAADGVAKLLAQTHLSETLGEGQLVAVSAAINASATPNKGALP